MRNSEFYSRNKRHFIHSFCSSTRSPGKTSVHQQQQQHSVSMLRNFHVARGGVHLLSLSPLAFFFCKHFVKSSWWMEHYSTWVVGIALTASLWPHWLFYSWHQCLKKKKCPQTHLDIFCLLLFILFFSCWFLTLDTVGRFCSVWYFNLSLIWILECVCGGGQISCPF